MGDKLESNKAKKEALPDALDASIAQRKRLEILSAFGTVDFDPTYDYKVERQRRGRKSAEFLKAETER
jgi:hypothetical protein